MITEIFDHILLAKEWLKDRKNSPNMLAFFATSVFQLSDSGTIGYNFKIQANETLRKISYDSSTLGIQQMLCDSFNGRKFEILNVWKSLPDFQVFRNDEAQPGVPIYNFYEVAPSAPIYKLNEGDVSYDFLVKVYATQSWIDQNKPVIIGLLNKYCVAGRTFKIQKA